MAEETKTPEKNEAKPRTPKAGDTVHAVCFGGKPGARFEKVHREATVGRVHHKGAFVDLLIAHESGDPARATEITRSPRDDSGQKPDSWHFPESE